MYRAAFVFLFLWLITRMVGRATLGELSTFQMLIYVTMGDLVQQAVTQQDYSVTSAVLAVGVFALLTILLTWLNARYSRVRPLTHGTPVVVIENGEPVLSVLRAEGISMDDLMASARGEGVERFGEIRLAVLESNGRIAFFTGEPKSGAAEGPAAG